MKNRRRTAILLACSLAGLTASGVWGQQAATQAKAPAATSSSTTASPAQSIRDIRRETLLYGIDSQILSLLQTMYQEKDNSLNPEVASIFETSPNTEVRQAALDLLRQVGDWGIASQVRQVLSDYLSSGSGPAESLILSCIQYLQDAHDSQAVPLLKKLASDQSQSIASAAINALGRSGDPTVSPMLIADIQDPSFPKELKAEAILAIGRLKPTEAVPVLTDIVKNPDNAAILREYACDSLGKIADPTSLPVIESLLSSTNQELRAYAVNSLKHFPGPSVDARLIQGLKDSFWRVRVSAAGSLGARKVTSAIPILEYKAKYDPVPNVEVAAISALGEIGGREAFTFLRGILSNQLVSTSLRETAAEQLIKNDLSGSLPEIEKTIKEDWAKSGSHLLTYICQKLSEAKDPGLKPTFERFLSSPFMVIQIYGIRGIGNNHFTSLLSKIEGYDAPKMPNAVRAAAEAAIRSLKQ